MPALRTRIAILAAIALSAILVTAPAALAAAPANDHFAAAITLAPASGGTLAGTNVDASLEVSENSPYLNIYKTVWYAWTAPASGSLMVDTCTSNFDTIIAVYTGTAYPLSEVGRDDDSCSVPNTLGSLLGVSVTGGTQYWIQVGSYGPADQGTFTLQWSLLVPPANDNLADAITLTPAAGGSLAGDNLGATLETSETRPYTTMNKTVWYAWTAPGNGKLTIDTCTSSFDTQMAVYTGSAYPLSEVSRDDDSCTTPNTLGSRIVSASVVGGTQYLIQVGSFGTTAQGTFTLQWAFRSATTTTTSVSSSAIVFGQTVTDRATITGTAPTDPTGTVQFAYCYHQTATPTRPCHASFIGSAVAIVPDGIADGIATVTLGPWSPAAGAGHYLLQATYLGDGTYATSADDGTNEVVVVDKAATSIAYSGDPWIAAGASAPLSAQLTSGVPACLSSQEIVFWNDADNDGVRAAGEIWDSTTTNGSGFAQLSKAGLLPGVYEVVVDFDETHDCYGSRSSGLLVVGSTDGWTGGGWSTVPGGKVSFGYNAKAKTVRGATTVDGQIVWISRVGDGYRLKGTISAYNRIACPNPPFNPAPDGTTCGVLTGTGTLYRWNGLTWEIQLAEVPFSIQVADGGVTTRKKSTPVLRPDYFRMDFPTAVVPGENDVLIQLKGGNVTIR